MSNESLQKQLKNVRKDVRVSLVPANPGMWKKEGEDHINLSRYSTTTVGRLLNLDNVRHWEHPILGPFRSLNTLWFFLKAKYKSDAIRSMVSHELKTYVNDQCGGQIGSIPNFRAVILDSAFQRIKVCRDIADKIVETTLPFDCYYTMQSGVCIRFEHSQWFSEGMEEIRAALKQKREPNFKKYKDAKGNIYDAVLELISPGYAEKAKEAKEAKAAKEAKPASTPQAPKAKKQPNPGKAVYDPTKIKNLDVQVEKTSPVALAEAVEMAVADAKVDLVGQDHAPVQEVLPDYKLAAADERFAISVDPAAGPAQAAIVEVAVGENSEKVVAVNVVEPEKPVNALQAALMSSGLAVEAEPAPLTGEAAEAVLTSKHEEFTVIDGGIEIEVDAEAVQAAREHLEVQAATGRYAPDDGTVA